MKNLLAPLLVGASLFALVGCNPEGTCTVPDPTPTSADSLGDECIVNTNKRACADLTSSSFFPETGAAGLLRCKSQGYTEIGASGGRQDPKALRMLYKKKGK